MLRPYLTVFKDSFHEAFASRVLWILLAVSTCILAAIAPLRLEVTQATELQIHSVRRWPELLSALKQASNSPDSPARSRIWSMGSDDFHKRLTDATRESGPRDPIHRQLPRIIHELNQILSKRDLYDAEAWRGTIINGQGRELLDRGIEALDDQEVKRLNRHLLVAAFPGELSGLPDEQVHLLYMGHMLGGPLPITASMMVPAVNGVVARVMDVFVGTVAVFVAILVTAPMIPLTFEAGAIDLLLSKPVHRQGLFLVKFLGGCVFILLNTAFFVIGIYLIVGWRFQIWNHNILGSIPIFLFLFAVYYSVSAWAGVIWRNATVSIVVTILFWASCFGVENAKSLIDRIYIEPERIVALTMDADDLMGLNQGGDLVRWSGNHWEISHPSSRHGRPFGAPPRYKDLTYDRINDEFLFIEKQYRRGPMSVLGPSIELIRLERSTGVWMQQVMPTPPRGLGDLLALPAGTIAVRAADGLFAVHANAKTDTPALSVFGVTLLAGKSEVYQHLTPPANTENSSEFVGVALDAISGDLILLGNCDVLRLTRNEAGRLVVARRYPLPVLGDSETPPSVVGKSADSEPAAAKPTASDADPLQVAISGDNLWIIQTSGRVQRWSGEHWLTVRDAHESDRGSPLQAFAAAKAKSLAIYYANGELQLLDDTGKQIMLRRNVTAVCRDGHDALLFSESGCRVMELVLGDGQTSRRCVPRRDLLHTAYDFVLVPLYRLFPKPARLGDVVNALMSKKAIFPNAPEDTRPQLTSGQFWQPVWTSAAFMVIVLGATCLYLQRADI